MPSIKIAVAGTFTAEPLADSLNFWSEKLQWQTSLAFAPYSQVFQQLLDPASVLSTNTRGINVILIRPQDWQRYEGTSSPALHEKLEQNAKDLIQAIRTATGRSAIPHVVCLCPASPAVCTDPLLLQVEQMICSELRRTPGVHLLAAEELGAYPVIDYYDADRDHMGHIPYTAEFFAAMGTTIARKIYALQQQPYKVIAVDCDETLWKGVCGEVGPTGIEIDAGRKALQEFLVAQHDAGMLICLCSKNNAEDVEEVFQRRGDMPLGLAHVVASRVNWKSKADNLRELASELQLGLESFVFIDDSPIECEQVKAHCPEILVLQPPNSPEQIPRFLENVWAFDKRESTEEDRKRTAFYRENQERDRFRQESPSLETFLAQLQLRVDIAAVTPEQCPRVAQLTQRTNQFNCTTIRRTDGAIQQLCASHELECLTVCVADRFGDYGLVGAVIYRIHPDSLEIDTFLLSCRVLGRGVENRVLSRVAEIALSHSISRVDVRFLPTKKNQPALDWLEAVGARFKEDAEEGFWFRMPAEYAAQLSERPVLVTSEVASNTVGQQEETRVVGTLATAPSELMQEIATSLCDAGSISRAVDGKKGIGIAETPVPVNRSRAGIEKAIIEIWRNVLSVSNIRSEDDFFLLGGDSLPAVQAVLQLNRIFGVSLTLQDIFENHTVTALASAIEGALRRTEQQIDAQGVDLGSQTASIEKQELTNYRNLAATPASATLKDSPEWQVIPHRKQISPCPLSFAQQSWWFLSQWAPASPDLSSCVLRLKGTLDVAALEHALDDLVSRHEALRTVFQSTEDGPVQIVSSHKPSLKLSIVDLLGETEAERESRAEYLIDQESSRPFDLASDVMLRPTLLRLGSDDHILILIIHHIASDASSREILLRELETLYGAFVQGNLNPLPSLSNQYADFAVWQHNLVNSDALQGQLEYWKQKLAGVPTRIELPRKRSASNGQVCRGAQQSIILPDTLASALRSLAQREGVTLFMVLLAAFQTLLHRYSGQEDIVVGSPEAGRAHPQTEGLVGCFINVLLLRTDFSGSPTFRELLARVRQVVLDARSHQELPLSKLVQELDPGRDLSQAPLFQVIFAFEKALSAPQLPGLEVSVRELDTRTALHDVSLFAAEVPQGLRLKFECKKDLFEPATIQRMLAHMSKLLEEIAVDPDRQVGRLPILDATEREQLTSAWNDSRHYPAHKCIHELFEDQVERTPEKIALVFEEQEMSYAELNQRSNQLARYLQRMGVGPDVLVGLCIERSLDMVISILAILKAGGGYLPLDPRYPKDRLGFMLSDARPPIVLAQYELKELFPEYDGQVVAVDADWAEIERESTENVTGETRPENLAYVIYTSGSTGRPKGCQITHYNVVRLFEATRDWYQFDERDVWTMFHSYAFDFSVWELWGALIYGGRLVVVPYLTSRSPEEFYRLLERQRVTVLNQTPSSFRQLMHAEEMLGAGDRLALRYVIFGGEMLEMQALKPWFERHGDQKPQLVNMYGITETTVHVTYRPLSLSDTASGSVIGRPLPDLQVYLLDRYLEPVPIGVPGEMYVGGAGVARGYLDRPELTAERFISDTFLAGAHARLYKTGDLARRLANGDIEYLGRIDQQVKIRGFRIELGEIESVLANHPGVRESVVIVSEGEHADKRLIAYFVAQKGQNPTSSELHAFLKEQVPEYMVPVAFVKLEKMPLTSNGKIDQRALPAPEMVRPALEIKFLAPRTPLEEEVANAWKRVLGLDLVGVKDNFFEIGGHSLLATRVIILLRANLGANLSLRMLFENPTVEGMASVLLETMLELTDEAERAQIIHEVETLSDEAARQIRATAAQDGVVAVPSVNR